MKKNMRTPNSLPKVKAGLVLLVMILAFFISNMPVAKAIPTEVILSIPEAQRTILQKIQVVATKLWEKAGQQTFNAALRNTLSRIAFDAAQYVGTYGEGQKPLFVTEGFGTYITNLGDAAAGDFIDTLGKNWQVDLCKPADPALTAKIGLGLVQYQRPSAPNCSLSQLSSNYTSAYEKYAAMNSGDFLKSVQTSFEPGGGEISTAFELFNRAETAKTTEADTQKLNLQVKQGWLSVTNIAGKTATIPGYEKMTIEQQNAERLRILNDSNAKDPFVAAANIFVNQLAYEGMQRVLREIGKGKSSSQPYNPASAYESLIQYGEKVVSEKLATIVKPRFNVRSDYSVLGDLTVCPNKNNPGPTDCVIDDKFSQAIAEKLTVAEALAKGYLHGDWIVSDDNKSDSTYTLRSAGILRKYRIVPVGWEQAIATASTPKYKGKITFQDLVSCFSGDGAGPFSADFDKNDQGWCMNLVDPNWVLKAPLNYCNKQGAGGQIVSSLISKDESGKSMVAVSRASDYCADEKTCIKEKTDGSCEVYGYCNEEKRTWNFSTDSCEPVYNTCQTFTRATDKQEVSYLENTLDYSTCDSGNAGCKQYAYNGTYSAITGNVSWDKNYSIFLNNQATNCNASSEGCTKLLRGKPGWGDTNFVMDSSFSAENIGDTSASTSTNWHWPIKNGVGTIISGKALQITGGTGASLYSDNTKSLLPKNLSVIPGWSYTLSADVMINSGDKVTLSFGDNGAYSDMADKNIWKTVSVIISASKAGTNNLNFSLVGTGAQVDFAVRNLKLTPNDFVTPFTNYALFPAYEKLMPAYLESACYNSTSGTGDYRLKDNAPAICNNYARKCNREEVGCELFTSVKDNFAVAAKANSTDYCDAKCVGYDTYLAKASYFYGSSADNLIPATSKACSAENAGCASFTNLDAASAGGETLEYYSKVRQCIKPDSGACGDFYSWDSSQLKVMSLKKDTAGNPYIVDAQSDSQCTKEIYNLPPTDPRYNPECREFYSKSGQITYHIYSNTVSCSDSCHTYRVNEKNIDKTLDAGTCVGTDKNWDAGAGDCYVCKNGGVWNAKQNACLYQTIPEEGTNCSLENVGCREYNGNNGNNLKLVASYDFEGDINGFSGTGGASVSQSLESTSKNGHSLAFVGNGTAEVEAQSFAKQNSAYVIKFMAKATSKVNAKISLENSDGAAATFGITDSNLSGNVVISGGSIWNLYEINLRSLDHEVKAEKLRIKADNSFFIDHIIINEINDRYYLIKGSSNIPDVCYYDMSGAYQGPNYNLGCSQYTDRSKTVHNLHQFSELCQDSAVGCELMIATNNSSDYYGYTLNLNATDINTSCVPGSFGCLEVKGHQAIYAVFDPSKQCNQADLGCSRFGYAQTTGVSTNWVDAYKKNLPDTYNSDKASPLCQASEVGCDTWTYGDGLSSYFKDPGLKTCIFKDGAWYKSQVKRCDANSDGKIAGTEMSGTVCITDADCGTKKCVLDTNKYDCKGSSIKTFGFGGADAKVFSPSAGFVGLCAADSATCGEYIDPVSRFASNLVYNPAAEDINNDGIPDKWTAGGGYYTQTIKVKPNKLYILQVEGTASQPVILNNFSTGGSVRVLGASSNNELSVPYSTINLPSNSLLMFYTDNNTSLNVSRVDLAIGANPNKVNISLREAIVNYQLSSNLDFKTCNGVVNTDAGCVLFNARTQAGRSGLEKLTFTYTPDGKAPAACAGSNCEANKIIKVSPDRICSRWLSCRTYIEDPITHERTCYGMGECDVLNDKNECGNFLSLDNTVRTTQNNTQNKNATGYALLNNYYLGAMKEVGQNTDAHFDFESNLVSLSCRRDVDAGVVSSKNPCTFDKNINDSLVLEPTGAPTDYPAHGKGYLKVLNYYQLSPQLENSATAIYTNQDYYINYLINTKGSMANAKLIITDFDEIKTVTPKKYVSFTDAAANGWVRKVYKFKIPNADGSPDKKQTKIKVYLTSDTTNTNTGYVYFDDINIEPVLQTGTNAYVSKDCRLYPGDDSLSCLSVNNNVIKDGLYGYCLSYDPLNPSVCLMWYPIDQIAPITRNTQSNLGYTGKFPLYYCSEANGNFQLVEKVKVFEVAHDWGGAWNEAGGNMQNVCRKILGHDCPATDTCSTSNLPSKTTDGVASGGNYDATYPTCGSDNYRMMINIAATSHKYYLRVYCVPNPDKILATTGEDTSVNKDLYTGQPGCGFQDAWVPYDNLFVQGTVHSADNGADATDKVKVLETVYDMAFSDDVNNFSVNKIRLLSTKDSTEFYHFTCDRFTQVVDSEGNNMAWTGRTGRSSIFSTSTPDFFFNIPGNYSYMPSPRNDRAIIKYGRNREDVPFGAAVLPASYDLLNSGLVNLRNQYSNKNNETIFAGRPYSCVGSSCQYIGQCSLDPNVFCIYAGLDDANSGTSKSEVNKSGCSAGGNGTCIALWETRPVPADAERSILNKIFMKKYSDYLITDNIYQPDSLISFSDIKQVPQCPGNNRPINDPKGSFCVVWPTVSNVKMTFGLQDVTGNGGFTATSGGLYQLEFNSSVDVEQQPLKQIVINWGDNNIQIINNLDNKPQAGIPHRFYHYYPAGTYKVEVKVIDNWESFSCCNLGGSCGNCSSI